MFRYRIRRVLGPSPELRRAMFMVGALIVLMIGLGTWLFFWLGRLREDLEVLESSPPPSDPHKVEIRAQLSRHLIQLTTDAPDAGRSRVCRCV
jgi:hypothetical protein